MVLQLPEGLTETDKKAFKEAKEMVYRLEQNNHGDLNKIQAGIAERQAKLDLTGKPSSDIIYQRRVTELASRYANVSDGKMDIDPKAHKTSVNNMVNALRGMDTNGGILPSQSAAIITGKEAHISAGNLPRLGRNAAVGVALSVTAGLAAAAEPNATPLKVADRMMDTAVPGWVAARQGQACKAFGEVAGVAASGAAMVATAGVAVTAGTAATVGTGGLAAPLVAVGATAAVVAAGGATYAATAPAAEAACNTVSNGVNWARNKLGM